MSTSTSEHPLDARARRNTGLAGVAFVVLFVGGWVVGGSTPDYTATEAEWTAWFDDAGNRAQQIVMALMLALSAVALVLFSLGVARRLRLAGAARAGAVEAIPVFGAVAAGLAVISATLYAAVSAGMSIGDGGSPFPGRSVATGLEHAAGTTQFVGMGIMASLLIAATTLAARGTGALPRWLELAGLPVAVIVAASVLFFPFLLFLAWALATGIAITVRPVRAESPTLGPPAPAPAAGANGEKEGIEAQMAG